MEIARRNESPELPTLASPSLLLSASESNPTELARDPLENGLNRWNQLPDSTLVDKFLKIEI